MSYSNGMTLGVVINAVVDLIMNIMDIHFVLWKFGFLIRS